MPKVPEYRQYHKVATLIHLNLISGERETVFLFQESLLSENPHDYDFLKWLPINTSTDICSYICAENILNNYFIDYVHELNISNGYDPNIDEIVYTIIPQLFLLFREKIDFFVMMENIRNISAECKNKNSIVFELLDKFEELISDDDYDVDELPENVMDIMEDIFGEKFFNEEAAEEITVPWPPIPISEIDGIEITCYKWCNRDYIDWYKDPEDVEEFASDAETAVDSEHFKFLLTKWTVFQYGHLPFAYEEILDGSYSECGYEDMLSVAKALQSGNLNNLLPEWWYDKRELTLTKNQNGSAFEKIARSNNNDDTKKQNEYEVFINNSTINNFRKLYKKSLTEAQNALRYSVDNKSKIVSSYEQLEYSPGFPLHFDCYDVYMFLKEFIENSDSETIRLLLNVLDIPDEFMEFWHIGIMHDAIEFGTAEQTAILLNSGKLRFTDEELEYLIDYAAKSEKTEHTACLLNYKNEMNNSLQ